MEFILNGKTVSAEPAEDTSLLELLRTELGVRSVKDGCAPEGSCGACTVIVEGRAVVSCAQKATRFEGKHVTTHEGLSEEERRLWSESFVAAGASQCGYCSPGIVMKAEVLLHKHPEPTREEVAHALLGNLCRCTGYVKVIDAIQLAAAARRGEPLPEPDRSGRVGSRTARYQGTELALGDNVFVGDMEAPGMLHGALRFSDHPRARILRIDTSKALAEPGVVAVLTAADVPGERVQGSIKRDWRQLVAEGEVTAYVGDVIAAVAAETRHAARAAAALVEVEYEVLEPVTDPFAALADGAPALHEGGNVLSVSKVQRGDVDAALAGAAHVVTESFRTQVIEHAFLEPESSLAVPDGDGPLEVYSQGQGVWDDRRQIASFLGLPEERVRVTHVPTGGAFGAKEDLNVQSHAALLATRTGRPVLLTLTRKESLRFHSKRHPMWLDYTVGCDEDGKLLAVRARIVGDTGAYASVGDKVIERAVGHACGAYEVDNVDIEGVAVYTNNPPCGAMRGFGVNQSNFAVEGVLDTLAEQVGIDGWEIRWRNALEVGSRFGTGPEARPGRRPQEDPARRQGRLPRRPLRRDRLRRQEHRHRQRHDRVRPRRAARRAGRLGDPVPLLDGDGPGRPHDPAADGVRGARAPARAGARRRRHRPRPRDGPDDGVPLHRARRARGDRRGREAEGGARRPDSSRSSRARSSGASSSSTGRRSSGRTSTSPSRTSRTPGRRRSRSSTTRAGWRRWSPPTTSGGRSTRRSPRARSRARCTWGSGRRCRRSSSSRVASRSPRR